MLQDGYRATSPTPSFRQSEGRQLAFCFDTTESATGEFISDAMMERLCHKFEIHLDAESIESFRNHLNETVCRQLQQPIKHIKTSKSEMFIYWDTWGVIRSANGHLRSGMQVWDESTNSSGRLFTSDTWYFLGVLAQYFVPNDIYYTWLENSLKSWQAKMGNTFRTQMPNTLMLISYLSAELSRLDSFAENALEAIVKALFSYLPNPHHLAWIAQDISIYDEYCPRSRKHEGYPDTNYEELYDDRAIRAAVAIPFECINFERGLLFLFGQLYKVLCRNREISGKINSGRELLASIGVTQNGRECLCRLTNEEVRLLVRKFPTNDKLVRPFFQEVQTTLLKMDQIRRSIGKSRRPYLTRELVNTIAVTSVLRLLTESKTTRIASVNLRDMLLHLHFADWGFEWNTLIALTEDDPEVRHLKYCFIKDALKLLELYRDALLTPVEVRLDPEIADDTPHMLDRDAAAWMDDGGTKLRQLALEHPVRLIEPKPLIAFVADWFLATSAVIDKQRAKRGWKHLESLATRWHERNSDNDYSWVLDYPDWKCLTTVNDADWTSQLPADSPYQIIPLTSPAQLLEESSTMNHCVATYVEACIEGSVRVFSVRSKADDRRIATAELRLSAGAWSIVQLKGKHNEELIQHLEIATDPMRILLTAHLTWYNKQHQCIPAL